MSYNAVKYKIDDSRYNNDVEICDNGKTVTKIKGTYGYNIVAYSNEWID